jgi:L-iditol 2-dehydrogenase
VGVAVVMRRPGEIALEERPDPVPGDGEVLVEVAVATICHTDYYILDGTHPSVSYPIVPGHEFSAVVRDVGPGARSVRCGDRVAIQTQLGCHACRACADGRPADCAQVRQLGSTRDGGWQELLVLPEEALYPVGDLSLTEAALIEPAANGHAAVRHADVAEGEVVVVVGPGPIGLMALMMARLKGAGSIIVIGRGHDRHRLRLARELGADQVVAADQTAADEVLRLTGARGADAVIQCAGSVDAFALALAVVGRRGRVVVEGYAGVPDTVPVSPDRLAADQLTISGVNGWALADFTASIEHAQAGRLHLQSLVTDRFSLADYSDALARGRDYPGGVVKVAFDVRS